MPTSDLPLASVNIGQDSGQDIYTLFKYPSNTTVLDVHKATPTTACCCCCWEKALVSVACYSGPFLMMDSVEGITNELQSVNDYQKSARIIYGEAGR